VPASHPDKALSVDLAIGLMQAVTPLGERAARLPAGHSNPGCHAGMSFTALRDAAPLVPGPAARRFFIERLDELAVAATAATAATAVIGDNDERPARSAKAFQELARRATRQFGADQPAPALASALPRPATLPEVAAPTENSTTVEGVDVAEGHALNLMFDTRRCIHARFCVTGAPTVFLANVEGPWLHPDTLDAERLVGVAQDCPSGAITYQRKDGGLEESAPPVNLASLREGGPYAFRGDLRLDGKQVGYRATFCRCGASANKPFCDNSHVQSGFSATGEPPSSDSIKALENRNGPLAINPQTDGPLQVRGNLEITSGTGRVLARLASARLCRCGASANKPFCDGSHARVNFRS
jgi:CDGSH-type Zn-finger protein/uncharacterized Fe-S cluster protein YjdI